MEHSVAAYLARLPRHKAVQLWKEWYSDRSFNGIFCAAVDHRAVSDVDTFVLYDWSKHGGSNTAIPKWNILRRSD